MIKKILITIVVLAGISFAISFALASFPTFTFSGKAFLISLSNNDYEGAYDMFTDEFKSQHTLKEFTDSIEQSGLNKYKSVEWVKTISNKNAGFAIILGVVNTYDHKKIPLQLRFIRVPGQNILTSGYRISEIRTHGSANEGLY